MTEGPYQRLMLKMEGADHTSARLQVTLPTEQIEALRGWLNTDHGGTAIDILISRQSEPEPRVSVEDHRGRDAGPAILGRWRNEKGWEYDPATDPHYQTAIPPEVFDG